MDLYSPGIDLVFTSFKEATGSVGSVWILLRWHGWTSLGERPELEFENPSRPEETGWEVAKRKPSMAALTGQCIFSSCVALLPCHLNF